MEIEHPLGNGMSTNATAHISERHICTRIDKFQIGLARFTIHSANSESTGEKVICLKNLLSKPWPISRTVRHLSTPLTTVMYCTVSLSKPYTQKALWAQSIVTAVQCEPGIRSIQSNEWKSLEVIQC